LSKEDLTRWREDLQTRLQRVQQHPEQNLGFIEENIRQSALELQRSSGATTPPQNALCWSVAKSASSSASASGAAWCACERTESVR